MSKLLHPSVLALMAVAALALASCSQASSKDAPKIAAETDVIPKPASATATQALQAVPSQPELIRALAAAPVGLSLNTPEGRRLFETVYDPDDCGDLGPDSEGPELPFDRYCVWPRDPETNVQPRVLTGIVDDRIVSVALIGHHGALPGWTCIPAPDAPNTELCVAAGTSASQADEWNMAWNGFVAAWISRP